MEIRLAELVDLNACLTMDDSFETDFVWQMDEQARPGNISVNFRLTRLPRPMRVAHVISTDDMIQNYHSGGSLFVADEGGVRGFVDVTAHIWSQAAYINNLAVAPGYRRKGIGTQLLWAACEWGRQQKLRIGCTARYTVSCSGLCCIRLLHWENQVFGCRLYC